MRLMNFLYRSKSFENNIVKKDSIIEEIVTEPVKTIKTSVFSSKIKSLNWLFSTRTNSSITNNHIYIGNDKIELTKINEIKLFSLYSLFNIFRYQVISFKYQNKYFYIGMESNKKWNKFLPNYEEYKEDKKNYIPIILFIIGMILYFFSKIF